MTEPWVSMDRAAEHLRGKRSMAGNGISLDLLLKLRLVVGRFGEMDVAKWWNTLGLLGPRGAIVLERGLPRTHHFAQARIVFSVARSRCNEIFSPPGCMTLWNLPSEIEDRFEEHWQEWLDRIQDWSPFFEKLANLKETDLLNALCQFDLISPTQIQEVRKLRRSAESRAVPIPGLHLPNDDILTLLAAGFSRGEVGNPAIPYARREDMA
jgi:hypothetical protein